MELILKIFEKNYSNFHFVVDLTNHGQKGPLHPIGFGRLKNFKSLATFGYLKLENRSIVDKFRIKFKGFGTKIVLRVPHFDYFFFSEALLEPH